MGVCLSCINKSVGIFFGFQVGHSTCDSGVHQMLVQKIFQSCIALNFRRNQHGTSCQPFHWIINRLFAVKLVKCYVFLYISGATSAKHD